MTLNAVFISHAKPEDNEFVRWLGNRLTGHGYRVWAELFDSTGGSPFWSDIESVIRDKAVKVISVVSKNSVATDRRGFRSELALADARGRSLHDPRFIIPVRIDDLLTEEFPAQLSQLHYIDFVRNWGEGCVELISNLERLGVPKPAEVTDDLFNQWRSVSEKLPRVVERAPEPALTNLVKVVIPPTWVRVISYSGNHQTFPAALKKSDVPVSMFYQLIVTLSDVEHLQGRLPDHFKVKDHSSYTFDEFLSGTWKEATRPDKADARNMVTAMLRQNIERHLRSRGLIEYESAQQSAFFFPKDLLRNDKVFYDAAFGKRTWKGVVGRSKKMQVFWHLAMKVNVVVRDEIVVRFKPYICWSEDGRTAITDAKRTSVMRRQFCKNWWNPQWRALQEAFLAFLADEKPTIHIELGTSDYIALDRNLINVELARRMSDDLTVVDQSDEPEEQDDEDIEDEDMLEEDEDL